MATEVEAPGGPQHEEHKFYPGDLLRIESTEGNYGPQWKWIITLDDDDPWQNDDGTEDVNETWMWCSKKLTTHEKNKFRKIVKGLTGSEPDVGELFHEEHYTKEFYEQNADEDPVANTGKEQPWRVALMFEHTTQTDKSVKESVTHLIRAEAV